MVCVYPNGVMLTKEQIESVASVLDRTWKAVKKMSEALFELVRSIVQSEGFQKLLSLLKDIGSISITRKQKWIRNMNFVAKSPLLDRRPRMFVIRNNC